MDQKEGLKVYIAASFPMREQAKQLALELSKRGIACTARWIHGQYSQYGKGTDESKCQFAKEDIADVFAADAVVVITEGDHGQQTTQGGRHTEVGIALALCKRVVIVGPREQVFHWHPNCVQVAFGSADDAHDRIAAACRAGAKD